MSGLRLPPWSVAALAIAAVLLPAPPAAALTPPLPKAAPLGPELQVSGPGPARRAQPAVAGFADGGFAVAWSDLDSGTVRLRLFDRDNGAVAPVVIVGDNRLARTVLARVGPDLAVLGDGTLLVVWADGSCPAGPGPASECRGQVLGRLYSPAGEALGEPFAIAGEEGAYSGSRVAALIDPAAPAGVAQTGFIVVWTVDHDASGCTPDEIGSGCNFSDVLGRLWNAAGEPAGPPFVVNERTADEQNTGGVAGLADGGFVAVWESWNGERFFDVVRRRFDAGGEPLEGDVQVNAASTDWGRQHSPAVAALSGGVHAVAWADGTYPSWRGGDDDSVAVQVFDENGMPRSSEFLAHGDSHGDQGSPALAGGGGGDFFVTWTDACPEALCTSSNPAGADGSGSGVLASFFTGAFLFGEVLLDQTVPIEVEGDQSHPDVAVAGDGWVSAWVSELAGDEPATEIRARRLGFFRPCGAPCLHGRFEMAVTWKDFQGNSGSAQPVVRGDDWVTFSFFHPDNVELAVKILDGRPVNGRFWVFAGALSNVEYRLTVSDTVTGLSTTWRNPSGTFLSRADTATFEAANEVIPGSAAVDREGGAVRSTTTSLARAASDEAGPCPAGGVCLQDGRFTLSASWRDGSGNQGVGGVLPLTADTAWVSFFHGGNPELVVKVLDGRPVNGHFWVFYASLSNVEFDLTVTDLATGETATYGNPAGSFASRGDTRAFPVE